MTDSSASAQETRAIDLKDPALSAFLAWLVPGLGHFYQGRTGKAVLFLVCILGTFVFGVYLGGDGEVGWGRVVYASWRENDKRLPYLCQIGVGLPAMPALVQASRLKNRKSPLLNGFMAPPRLKDDPNEQRNRYTLDELNKKLGAYFELGTVYTMIAGLLNVLAIYDAWGGPVFAEGRKKEEEEEEDRPAEGQGRDLRDGAEPAGAKAGSGG